MIEITNEDGSRVAYNDDGCDCGVQACIVNVQLQPALYYVTIAGLSSEDYGAYQIHFMFSGSPIDAGGFDP